MVSMDSMHVRTLVYFRFGGFDSSAVAAETVDAGMGASCFCCPIPFCQVKSGDIDPLTQSEYIFIKGKADRICHLGWKLLYKSHLPFSVPFKTSRMFVCVCVCVSG
jgi:hypothetical protein